ncbi:MAG: hypothetical protein ACREF0_15110, partial [Acetobacteraceae bacterium]
MIVLGRTSRVMQSGSDLGYQSEYWKTDMLRGGFHNYLRLIRRNCSACCANAHVCRSGMENG